MTCVKWQPGSAMRLALATAWSPAWQWTSTKTTLSLGHKREALVGAAFEVLIRHRYNCHDASGPFCAQRVAGHTRRASFFSVSEASAWIAKISELLITVACGTLPLLAGSLKSRQWFSWSFSLPKKYNLPCAKKSHWVHVADLQKAKYWEKTKKHNDHIHYSTRSQKKHSRKIGNFISTKKLQPSHSSAGTWRGWKNRRELLKPTVFNLFCHSLSSTKGSSLEPSFSRVAHVTSKTQFSGPETIWLRKISIIISFTYKKKAQWRSILKHSKNMKKYVNALASCPESSPCSLLLGAALAMSRNSGPWQQHHHAHRRTQKMPQDFSKTKNILPFTQMNQT